MNSWLLPPLPPTFDAAVRDVRAQHAPFRAAAAERLGTATDAQRPQAMDGLRALLEDPVGSVRCAAITALGKLGEPGAIDWLAALLDDPIAEVREQAAFAVAQIGGAGARAALRYGLSHPAPEVRFHAVAGLADLAPADWERDLLPLVGDRDPQVRGQLVVALASLARSGEHHTSLRRLLADPVPSVRTEAALALAPYGDEGAERALVDALVRGERTLEVADALAQFSSADSADALAAIALGLFTRPRVRAATGSALWRRGDPRGEKALRRALRSFSGEARSTAGTLLAQRPPCQNPVRMP